MKQQPAGVQTQNNTIISHKKEKNSTCVLSPNNTERKANTSLFLLWICVRAKRCYSRATLEFTFDWALNNVMFKTIAPSWGLITKILSITTRRCNVNVYPRREAVVTAALEPNAELALAFIRVADWTGGSTRSHPQISSTTLCCRFLLFSLVSSLFPLYSGLGPEMQQKQEVASF